MRFPAVVLVSLLSATFAFAQSTSSATATTSDFQALTLAKQSIAALTGGSSISDITLNASVISIFGSDNETGTGTFQAKGAFESRADLSLSGGTLSEVRNLQNNGPAGAWSRNGGSVVRQASHNVLTDASWFYPGLSCLSEYGGANYVFKYFGLTQHGSANAQHIQVASIPSTAISSLQRLSTTDVYLDPVSFLPLAIDFKAHPDADMNTDIPVEILFANYQPVNGVQVPFHIQKMLDGGVVLDISVTSAVLNTGILDSSFTLQ